MNTQLQFRFRRREGGQTIIVAMIVLGLLLIIGFVFIGIINRNVKTTGRLQDRSTAADLSEAGIRYAHNQMLRSELGADWRGTPTPPIDPDNDGLTYDPDALYLRPAAFATDGSRLRYRAGNNAPFDQGGPDGLGPYFRINYSAGRSLVRVMYSNSDANLFRLDPLGALRNPGLARNYLMIESVGREGRVNVNDPTTLTGTTQRRYQGFADQATFQSELALLREGEARQGAARVNRAFVSIGIIEHARFITNKFRNSRPAELGISDDLGARDRNGTPIASNALPAGQRLRAQVGTSYPVLTLVGGNNASLPAGNFPGGGSMYVNGDVKLFGVSVFNLNATLGDQINVAGTISTDDPNSLVLLNVARVTGGNWTNTALAIPPAGFSSLSNSFDGQGLIRDGLQEMDRGNRPRGVGYKSPPSILTRDPQTGSTRYGLMARESGVRTGTGNSGLHGYGRNVYVNNGSRRQMPLNAGSGSGGGESSLVNEWLSPGGDPSATGWRGWLYAPPGAYMELLSDGFTIQRDGTGDEAIWRLPNGNPTTSNFITYRLGRGSDGRLHVVNTFTFADVNRIHQNLGTTDFDSGPEFGGVVYFEGNVRVRGTIPTDVQLSVVSNATVYIEGSITKGVTGNQFTATYNRSLRPNTDLNPTAIGSRLVRPSRSMLILMAKDYVTVNTTQFFGASRFQTVVPKEDTSAVGALNPLVVRASDPTGLRMNFDMVLDPNGPSASPQNPASWRPFNLDYAVPGAPSSRLNTNLLITHTMDNGGGDAAFVTMDVNSDFGNSTYGFPASDSSLAVPFSNVASEFLPGAILPIYGLGSESFERYGNYESLSIPLINPTLVTVDAATNSFISTATFGGYRLLQTGLNDLRIRPTSVGGMAVNDYLVGRLAVTPHDIRIEASIYAEEGSFFVIPGSWFNPNPNDTLDNWNAPDAGGGSLSSDEKNLRRLRTFGVYPQTPFFGEPLDVKINIVGAVSENMPVPISVQNEWIRKWGWIPREHGSSGESIPEAHARGIDLSLQNFVPNLTVTYDPVLATGRVNGFVNTSDPNDTTSPLIRVDEFGRPLPPLPRLPVSPTLAFFGEVR